MHRNSIKIIIWVACLIAAFIAIYTLWLSIVYQEGILYLEPPLSVLEYGAWKRVSGLLAPVYMVAVPVGIQLAFINSKIGRGLVLTGKQSGRIINSILFVYGAGLGYTLYVTLKFRNWLLYVGKEPYKTGDLPIDFGSCLYPVIFATTCMILCILYAQVCRSDLTKKS